MVIPVKYPPKLTLAENQVVFSLKGTDAILASGTQAKIILYFGNVNFNAVNQKFSITFSGNTYMFSSALVPDQSGLQFRGAVTGDTNLTWMQKIAEDLSCNYYISENYDITYTYNRVVLTSKNVGVNGNITGQVINVPGMSITSYAGTDDQENPFYKIFLQVIANGQTIGEDMLPVDALNVANFDISEYLTGLHTVDFAFPAGAGAIVYKRNAAVVPYYVRYGGYYGNPPAIKKLRTSGVFYSIPGGVDFMTEGKYNAKNTSFYAQLKNTGRFLTWHPERKRTQQNYREKLWYIIHTAVSQVKIKVRLNFTHSSGTFQTVVTKKTIPAQMWDMLEICCGYNEMQLCIDVGLSNPNYKLISWDVYVTNEMDQIISPLFNFYFDDENTLFDRQFIFSNSFRVYELFASRAIGSKQMNYERKEIQISRPKSYKNTFLERKNYLVKETSKNTVEIGNFHTSEEKYYLSELLLSREVYEIINDTLYPVIITGATKTAVTDDEYMNNVLLEYSYAYTDQHHSVNESVISIAGNIIEIASQVPIAQQLAPTPYDPMLNQQQLQTNSSKIN